jgi:hypothetical protein
MLVTIVHSELDKGKQFDDWFQRFAQLLIEVELVFLALVLLFALDSEVPHFYKIIIKFNSNLIEVFNKSLYTLK